MERPQFSNTFTIGNIATIATLVVMIGAGFRAYGNIETQLADYDRRMATVEAQAANVPVMSARIATIEGQMTATMERLGASLNTLSERMDRTNTGLADIKTEVAVIRQRIDGMTPERRTELFGPTSPP